MTRKTRIGTLAAAGVLALALAGCDWGDKVAEPYQDAKRSGNTNSTPADVIEMPDGFSNLAAKCDGPNRVYVAFHGDSAYGAMAVVPNDPRCTGGAR